MTTAVMEADDVQAAFGAALRKDAVAAPPEIPAPPRRPVPDDPEAPFGRDDDGDPIAPHGLNKKTGRPNLKAPTPGAGRPPKADRPRVQDAPRTQTPAGPAKDYSEDLAGLATTAWLAGAGLQATAPYAGVLKQSTPALVQAWNKAAQQNSTVRRQVEKLAGDGSWAWIIGVTVATVPVVMGMWDLMKPIKDPKVKAERDQIKTQLAEHTRAEAQQFVETQLALMAGPETSAESQLKEAA